MGHDRAHDATTSTDTGTPPRCSKSRMASQCASTHAVAAAKVVFRRKDLPDWPTGLRGVVFEALSQDLCKLHFGILIRASSCRVRRGYGAFSFPRRST